MCKPVCIYCGFQSDEEIITHINDAHPGGLGSYLLFFGAAPVVSEEVFAACTNAVHGVFDTSNAVLMRLKNEDISAVVSAWTQSLPLRSTIENTEDF